MDFGERDLHHLASFVRELARSVVVLVGILDALDFQAHQRIRQFQNLVPFWRHFSSEVAISEVSKLARKLHAELEFFVELLDSVLGIASHADSVLSQSKRITQSSLKINSFDSKNRAKMYLNSNNFGDKSVHASVGVNRVNGQRNFNVIAPMKTESIFFILLDDRAVDNMRAFIV